MTPHDERVWHHIGTSHIAKLKMMENALELCVFFSFIFRVSVASPLFSHTQFVQDTAAAAAAATVMLCFPVDTTFVKGLYHFTRFSSLLFFIRCFCTFCILHTQNIQNYNMYIQMLSNLIACCTRVHRAHAHSPVDAIHNAVAVVIASVKYSSAFKIHALTHSLAKKNIHIISHAYIRQSSTKILITIIVSNKLVSNGNNNNISWIMAHNRTTYEQLDWFLSVHGTHAYINWRYTFLNVLVSLALSLFLSFLHTHLHLYIRVLCERIRKQKRAHTHITQ